MHDPEPFVPKVPGIDYGILDSLLGYAVRRAQIQLYEDFIPSLAPWGITPPRFSAMVIVSRNPGLKLTQLAITAVDIVQVNFPDFGWVNQTFKIIASRLTSEAGGVGKKPTFGNNRSHSMVATKRRFDPNLQRVRMMVDGIARRAYVCTRCLKSGKVTKAV